MFFFKKVCAPGKYQDDNAIPDLINYIMHPDKTPSGIKGAYRVDPNNIAGSMIAVSEKFGKNSRIRLHHFIVSFGGHNAPKRIWMATIAQRICEPIAERYQIAYALHEDTKYLHIHFVFNAVSYVDGYKYRNGEMEYKELIRLADHAVRIFDHYGIRPESYTSNIREADE